MTQSIFEKLIANKKAETIDSNIVGFTSQLGNYFIHFYGALEDNHELIIGECHLRINKDIGLTKSQLKELQEIILANVPEQETEQPYEYINQYEEFGVENKNFY